MYGLFDFQVNMQRVHGLFASEQKFIWQNLPLLRLTTSGIITGLGHTTGEAGSRGLRLVEQSQAGV